LITDFSRIPKSLTERLTERPASIQVQLDDLGRIGLQEVISSEKILKEVLKARKNTVSGKRYIKISTIISLNVCFM
jgi:hypothetical protein